MIIIITAIKKKIYEILTSKLNYNVIDNPYDIETETERVLPYIQLSLNNVTRDRIKDAFMHRIKFKMDIFSDYDGEAEVLDMEEKIFDQMKELYDLKYITYIQESSFRILDDKSTGVNRKHGIITYTIVVSGMEQEVEENAENDSTNP